MKPEWRRSIIEANYDVWHLNVLALYEWGSQSHLGKRLRSRGNTRMGLSHTNWSIQKILCMRTDTFSLRKGDKTRMWCDRGRGHCKPWPASMQAYRSHKCTSGSAALCATCLRCIGHPRIFLRTTSRLNWTRQSQMRRRCVHVHPRMTYGDKLITFDRFISYSGVDGVHETKTMCFDVRMAAIDPPLSAALTANSTCIANTNIEWINVCMIGSFTSCVNAEVHKDQTLRWLGLQQPNHTVQSSRGVNELTNTIKRTFVENCSNMN